MENIEQLKEILDKVKDDEKLVETYFETFNEFFEKIKKEDANINVLECMFTNFVSLAYEPTKVFLSSSLVIAPRLSISAPAPESVRITA